MKKSSVFVIVIPLVIIAIIIAVVFAMRSASQKVSELPLPASAIPTLKGAVGKPNAGFSNTKTTTAIGDLSSDLRSTQDDGTDLEFTALASEAAKL